ncbi:uncharacterized protein ARMOST_11886 [Armillaria ostoyae]|uniref:Protein kinase domain-containing protein n=1 Tax=Armillaria ostoyae TaxID=47428 RepID=A0A284RIE7_ARMOS|nr:uncharacterized protein ARMOST_11886 [Armillaria ostoyae]
MALLTLPITLVAPKIILLKQYRNIHCPAHNTFNCDVLIRLVSIDGDVTGSEHWCILDRLSIGDVSYRGNNHTVPVLQTLEFEGLRFAVFPLMWPHSFALWFWDIGEFVQFIFQILEGIVFFHEKKIVHLDISEDNVLLNFAGGTYGGCSEDVHALYPFRSHFPVRYYLTDFEMGEAFDEDKDMLVTGLPNVRKGGKPEEYGRYPAPEMAMEEAYDPFRVDVWQAGKMMESMLNDNVGKNWRSEISQLAPVGPYLPLHHIYSVLKQSLEPSPVDITDFRPPPEGYYLLRPDILRNRIDDGEMFPEVCIGYLHDNPARSETRRTQLPQIHPDGSVTQTIVDTLFLWLSFRSPQSSTVNVIRGVAASDWIYLGSTPKQSLPDGSQIDVVKTEPPPKSKREVTSREHLVTMYATLHP